MPALPARHLRSRALTHLRTAACAAAALALTACVADPGFPRYAGPAPLPGAARPSQLVPLPGGPPTASSQNRRIAILLPLTGPTAEIGQALLKAAQLSLDQPGAPQLDQLDTAGTPDGAATAARTAATTGAGIIIGPLTAAETAAAAPIARAANIPMLAFTSDATQAQPGVWTLGITPAQQVRRLVLAAQAENKTRIAAILPPNLFGDALANGLTAAAAAAGIPPPRIVRAPATFAATSEALKDVAAYNARRGANEQRPSSAATDPEARRQAAELARAPVPPPPIDVLLLAATGDLLGQTVPLLAAYDIPPDQVRIIGPALWSRDAPRQPALAGAWFAAPEPAQRAAFEQAYATRFTTPARDFASLAYDAAGIAQAAAGPTGFNPDALTRPEGFTGADGLLALQPDGQVRRGLAIFEIDRGGAHIVQPAPRTLAAPGT